MNQTLNDSKVAAGPTEPCCSVPASGSNGTSESSFTAPQNQTTHFVSNVLWNWVGVLTTLVVALLLPPVIIAHVGFRSYTVWMFALSFIDYFWLADLGLRSATINLAARFWTEKNTVELGRLVRYSLLFSAVIGFTGGGVAHLVAPVAARFFGFTDPVFTTLFRMVTASWAVMLIFTTFSSVLEGCQRFDLTSRAWVTSLFIRTIGIMSLVGSGYGLVTVGWMLVAAQMLWCVMIAAFFRSALPSVRLLGPLGNRKLVRELTSYAIHTFVSSVSNFMLHKSTQPMIVKFLGSEAFGVFFLPRRLLDYLMDGIGRIGIVTAPNATELKTRGRTEELASLGIHTNRYSLAIFLPAAVYLTVYGDSLFEMWIHSAKDSAQQAADLLPAMLIGQLVAAGQFNSGSILFGIGKHKTYSRSLLIEGLVVIVGSFLLLPTLGMGATAWMSSLAMIVNRGLVLNYLLSRELQISPFRYAFEIYASPLAVGLGCGCLLMTLKWTWLPGDRWVELGAAGFIMITVYCVLLFRFALAPHHRLWIIQTLRSRFGSSEEAHQTARG